MFPLTDKPLQIGRATSNEMAISDRQVSAQHAVIELKDGEYVLRDLESRHGTEVNGMMVSSAILKQGDEISIGPVTMIFESALVPVWTVTHERATLSTTDRRHEEPTHGDSDRGTQGTSGDSTQ
jgi:pSer/pThr/pTyr-binding forkhead associated (FHA) protein